MSYRIDLCQRRSASWRNSLQSRASTRKEWLQRCKM